MTEQRTFPAPPPELQEAGRALWEAVGDDDLEMRPDELAILTEAAGTRDVIANLVESVTGKPAIVTGSRGQDIVAPALQELRQQRQLLATLLRQLGFTDPEEGGESWDNLTASQRARKAAGKRYGR
jgi:hypothetical protein